MTRLVDSEAPSVHFRVPGFPWAVELRYRQPQLVRASRRSRPKLRSAVFEKLVTTTPDFTRIRCWGGFFFAPWWRRDFFSRKKSRDFTRQKFRRKNHVARKRAFSVLLISDGADVVLPLRHQQAIFAAATGPKELWIVPEADHASAMGVAPEEYERRVLSFLTR